MNSTETTTDSNSIRLSILTFNIWGIPIISSDHKRRIKDIARQLNSCRYDIVSLQEVWSENDRRYLRNATRQRLPYCHYFHSGVLGAGLLVLSKYPIVDTIFHAWPVNGYPHRIQHADWFGGKGIGFCRIMLDECTYVHLYNTHLHAEYDSKFFNYNAHRVIQAFDTAQFIAATRGDAALQILAGDLNTNPDDFAYKILLYIADLMDTCNLHGIATYGNPDNMYTSRSAIKPDGERIDHILYRAGKRFNASIMEYKIALPEHVQQYRMSEDEQPEACNLSDHEPVNVIIRLIPFYRKLSASRASVTVYQNDEPVDSNNRKSIYETSAKLKVTKQAINFCTIHLQQLKTDQMFYSAFSFVLFILTFVDSKIYICNGCEMIGNLLQLIMFIVGLYFMFMATVWNSIERNGIQSVKTAMELKIHSWSSNPRSVFSSMSDQANGSLDDSINRL